MLSPSGRTEGSGKAEEEGRRLSPTHLQNGLERRKKLECERTRKLLTGTRNLAVRQKRMINVWKEGAQRPAGNINARPISGNGDPQHNRHQSEAQAGLF